MRPATHRLTIETNGQGLTDVTPGLRRFVAETAINSGLLTVWCRHTSASLIVQENADPDMRADLLDFLRRLVPEGDGYRHADEGPDDMPAHIKAALTLTQLSIPIEAAGAGVGLACDGGGVGGDGRRGYEPGTPLTE